MRDLTTPPTLNLLYQRDQQISRLQTEITRLRAVVNKLPRTADGVRVVPTVDGVFARTREGNVLHIKEQVVKLFGYLSISDCYSTREAAEHEGSE